MPVTEVGDRHGTNFFKVVPDGTRADAWAILLMNCGDFEVGPDLASADSWAES